ncbi:MAG TPA: hypothetical protein PLJ98_05040, partial [Acholeplasmataceae bacterium]|nr:hypothetical protein [Acholeplasmataceae bacterium]
MFTRFLNQIKTKDLMSLSDLEAHLTDKFRITASIRRTISILIIDNEGFEIEPLATLGYTNITKIFEHVRISDYEPFDIILCDINGVAMNLDKEYQGAA